MKNLRKLLFLPLTLLLSSCAIGVYDIVESEYAKAHYYGTINFDTRGGDRIASISYIQGRTKDITNIIPHKEGHDFYGWSQTQSSTLIVKSNEVFRGDEVTVYANYYDDFDSNFFITGGYPQSVINNQGMVDALGKRVGKKSGIKVYDEQTKTYYEYGKYGSSNEFFYVYEPMVFSKKIIDEENNYIQLIADRALLAASLNVVDSSVRGYMSTYAYKHLNEVFLSEKYFSTQALSMLSSIATFPTGEEVTEHKLYYYYSKALDFQANHDNQLNTRYFMLRDQQTGSLCKVYDRSKEEIVDYDSGYAAPVIIPVLYSKNYQSIQEAEIEKEKNALIVSFNTDGGTSIQSVELEKNSSGYGTFYLDSVTPPTKEAADVDGYATEYTFQGWSLEKDGEIISGNSIYINKPTTLYAVYSTQKVLKSHKVTLSYKYPNGYPSDVPKEVLNLYVTDDPVYLYHKPVEGLLQNYVVAGWFKVNDSAFSEPVFAVKNVTENSFYCGRLVQVTYDGLRYVTLHEGDKTYKVYFLTGDKKFGLPDCINSDEKWVDDSTGQIYKGSLDLTKNHSFTACKVKEHTITFNKVRDDAIIGYESKTIYYTGLEGQTYKDQIGQLPVLVVADKTIDFVGWTYGDSLAVFSLTDAVQDKDIVLVAHYRSNVTEYGTYVTLNMDAIQNLDATQYGELPPSFIMMLDNEDHTYVVNCYFMVGNDYYVFYDSNNQPVSNIVHPAGKETKIQITLTLKKLG